MNLLTISKQLNNLKTLLSSVIYLAINMEALLSSEQKTALDKVVTNLKKIPVSTIEKEISEAYKINLTKEQIILAGGTIEILLFLLQDKK